MKHGKAHAKAGLSSVSQGGFCIAPNAITQPAPDHMCADADTAQARRQDEHDPGEASLSLLPICVTGESKVVMDSHVYCGNGVAPAAVCCRARAGASHSPRPASTAPSELEGASSPPVQAAENLTDFYSVSGSSSEDDIKTGTSPFVEKLQLLGGKDSAAQDSPSNVLQKRIGASRAAEIPSVQGLLQGLRQWRDQHFTAGHNDLRSRSLIDSRTDGPGNSMADGAEGGVRKSQDGPEALQGAGRCEGTDGRPGENVHMGREGKLRTLARHLGRRGASCKLDGRLGNSSAKKLGKEKGASATISPNNIAWDDPPEVLEGPSPSKFVQERSNCWPSSSSQMLDPPARSDEAEAAYLASILQEAGEELKPSQGNDVTKLCCGSLQSGQQCQRTHEEVTEPVSMFQSFPDAACPGQEANLFNEEDPSNVFLSSSSSPGQKLDRSHMPELYSSTLAGQTYPPKLSQEVPYLCSSPEDSQIQEALGSSSFNGFPFFCGSIADFAIRTEQPTGRSTEPESWRDNPFQNSKENLYSKGSRDQPGKVMSLIGHFQRLQEATSPVRDTNTDDLEALTSDGVACKAAGDLLHSSCYAGSPLPSSPDCMAGKPSHLPFTGVIRQPIRDNRTQDSARNKPGCRQPLAMRSRGKGSIHKQNLDELASLAGCSGVEDTLAGSNENIQNLLNYGKPCFGVTSLLRTQMPGKVRKAEDYVRVYYNRPTGHFVDCDTGQLYRLKSWNNNGF
eukprot:jgi/Botrbrau1/21321/Bobra.0184s0031.1